MNEDQDKFFRKLYKNLKGWYENTDVDEQATEVIKSTNSIVLKEFKQEERLCTEIVYTPIVKDLHGDWMSEETIKDAEASFRANFELGLVKANLFHVATTDKFEIKRSWLLPEDATFEGRDSVVPKGTWLAETHYPDDTLWEMKKSRKVGGLSLGGYGDTNTVTGEITNLFFSKAEFLEKKKSKLEVK
jgi:hypothetical protein